MIRKEAIIIGLGISGCVAARLLADSGYEVTCFEQGSHIGGSLFEEIRPNGIRVQARGPHVFHTDHEAAYQYLRRFGSFYPYRHRVLGRFEGKTFPMPLNASSLEILFGEEKRDRIIERLHACFPDAKRVSVDQLNDSSDPVLIDLSRFIIENLLMPDLNIKEGSHFIPANDSYENDAYVDVGFDDCYYTDKYQAMPMQGFTALMENMLSHPAITVYLDMDALSRISFVEHSSTILLDGVPFNGKVVSTASLDSLFSSRFGSLSFRASKLTFKDIAKDFAEEAAVIVTPHSRDCVRVSESKHITLQELNNKTTICMESPYVSYVNGVDEPFEPCHSQENLDRYAKYLELSKKYPTLYLLGRLADYENLSIAESVEEALNCFTSKK